ncbi:MAG: winged helix-turn-helix transcriptional regulator [Chloroflexi bacterium]|nr:winged helix-turn-helix transcriptional regulator [Chloroflexota bacterium]
MANWGFVTNHGAVLALISEHRQITAREIALRLGITERSVHRIIADLEREGYIQRERVGRFNWYEVNSDLPLRHPEMRDIAVGKLLDALLPGGVGDELLAAEESSA